MTVAATWAACLSPPGKAAIAVIAVRGPRAWDVTHALFSGRAPLSFEPGRFWLGRLGRGLADEVVLAVKQATPIPWIEIHCHGGIEVVRLLLETLEAEGVQTCSWQDFERHDADPPRHAEAVISLARALTPRTAAILLDQYHGALERALSAIQDARRREDQELTRRLVEELAKYATLGRHLTTPWRVALLGPPNVGKSSLVNALAGFQRSAVSITPGTTRDVVTTVIAVEGWPVELCDTAGLRDDAGALEEQGIDRARATAATADLCLWLLDAATPPLWPDPMHRFAHLVVNKMDLPAAWDLSQARDALHVSAATGAGLPELCHALAGWLVPEPPPPGAAVPFTPHWHD